MSESCGTFSKADRKGERGEARLKFLIVVALIALVAYAGYQYVPVAYNAYLFKDVMQSKVDKASAEGRTAEWVKHELTASAPEYGVPSDAVVVTEVRDGRMQANVQFARPVQLPIYTYQYTFNHTVKSTDLFSVK